MKTAQKDPSRFRHGPRNTVTEIGYRAELDRYIETSGGTFCERMENFAKYTPRQAMARTLALHEIFKLALPVQGDVIECGVNWGGGLMAFAQFSAIHEPVNIQRRIVGFDTFGGFPSLHDEDRRATRPTAEMAEGGYAAESYDDLLECIALFDRNRFIGHVPKVYLVKGDATETIPAYMKENPQTVVSVLHLDFDLYEPTKVALDHFVPRIPKGGVIVFDELNNASWPGETAAVCETIGLSSLRIQRFPFEPHISYAVVG